MRILIFIDVLGKVGLNIIFQLSFIGLLFQVTRKESRTREGQRTWTWKRKRKRQRTGTWEGKGTRKGTRKREGTWTRTGERAGSWKGKRTWKRERKRGEEEYQRVVEGKRDGRRSERKEESREESERKGSCVSREIKVKKINVELNRPYSSDTFQSMGDSRKAQS